jgi:hypothetical protein
VVSSFTLEPSGGAKPPEYPCLKATDGSGDPVTEGHHHGIVAPPLPCVMNPYLFQAPVQAHEPEGGPVAVAWKGHAKPIRRVYYAARPNSSLTKQISAAAPRVRGMQWPRRIIRITLKPLLVA